MHCRSNEIFPGVYGKSSNTMAFEVIHPGRKRVRPHRETLTTMGFLVAKFVRHNISSGLTTWGYHNPVMMQIEIALMDMDPFRWVTVVQLAKYVCPWLNKPTVKLRYRRFYGFQIHTAAGSEYCEVARSRRYEASSDDDERYWAEDY